MELKSIKKKFDGVLTLVLTIVALTVGQNAWAASTFTVSSPQNNNTFRITRTGNTAVSETIDWRVVSLSAIAGVHFTGYNGNYSGTVTFNVNDTYKDVTISESTPGDNAYKYQNDNSRSYRFEVLDKNGDILASKDRTITSGLTQFRAAKVSSNISNLVTMSSGNFSSGMNSSKYLDVSYTPPSSDVQTSNQDLPGYVLIDDSYDYANKPAVVSTSTLINSTNATASYLNTLGYKIYATVCFTEKERDDGYQYLQIVAGNSAASYDTGADKNGQVSDPVNSVYKVCFEFADGSNAEGKAYFPHRGTGSGEFSNSAGVLHQQKYKSGYDGNGSVILPANTSYITTRFDAGGDNDDTWGYKDFFVRMALCDATAPTVLNDYKVSGGRHQKGNTIYVSVPFKEIVTGTPTLSSNWGTLSYVAGSGSNVLTFKGEISSDATGTFSVTGYSGTIKDLAGNIFSGSISHNFGTVLDADYAWSTSDFNGLNDGSYEIYTTQDLRHLALMVNSGNNNCSGLTFKQTHDITYTHTTNWNNSSSQEDNYNAIGTISNKFQGTFDGQNYTISGIRLYKDADDNQGLFGYISGGTVRGVNLADTRITGRIYVGGIAGGIFQSTVEDCSVAADVCIHAVKSSSDNHGGIVGYSQGTVQRCLSRASLTVANATVGKYYGAILGDNNTTGHTVKDCIAIGATVPNISNYRGAIIGHNNSNSTCVQRNYYRACSVAGVENATGVGVGYDYYTNSPHDLTTNQGAQALYAITLPNGASVVRTASATLPGTGNKTYTTGADIDGTPYAYATATLRLSYTGAAPAEGYTYALYINGVQATDNGDGTYTATMPAADATVTVSTVVIPWSGSGDSENAPYLIQYRSQLDLLATNVNAGTDYSGKFFKLGNDIAYSSSTAWDNTELSNEANNFTAIGGVVSNTNYYFSGTFDGDGHTVSGIRITQKNKESQGLFGLIGTGGTVKNLTLSNARIFSNKNGVGGIAGISKGTITNCHVTADVNILGNGGYHGGIVGNNNGGTITGCTSAAALNRSGNYMGGIAGQSYSGIVSNCIVTGVSYSCDNNYYLGAIVGYKFSGTLSNNYYHDCSVNGATTNIGVGTETAGVSNDVDGARSVHSVTLPTGVTATGESVVIDAVTYYAHLGTVTLTYGGTSGYTVSYSCNDGSDHAISGNTFTMPGADITVSASLVPITYNITYDLAGGELPSGQSNPATYTVESADITLVNPVSTLEGYSFAGWTGSNGTTPQTSVTIAQGSSTGELSFTAHWEITPWTGSGNSENDPYIINYPSQLNLLATCVNDKTSSSFSSDGFTGKFFKLGADIAYAHTTEWNDASSEENNYTVIGTGQYTSFRGTFDGDGHTVSGIRIYKGADHESSNLQGLFGYVLGGTVKNVTLSDARITGRRNVGGIVGFLTDNNQLIGTVNNCHVDGNVAIHTVVSDADYHGGIVGYSGTILNCTSRAVLTVADNLTGCDNYGGIVGQNMGPVSNCLAIGATIQNVIRKGAIVGFNDTNSNGATLNANYYHDCTMNGTVNATNVGTGNGDKSGARSVHSLTLADGITASGESVTIGTDTYYASNTTITLNCTPPVGYAVSEYIVDGMAITGNTFTMPAADVSVTADYIMTWASLKSAMQNGGTFTLSNDITATETDIYLYVPSGKTVTLDLNGHTINRNLTAAVSNGYVIRVEGTLTINDSSDSNTGTITGGYNSYQGGGVYVSGNFTMNGGTISNNTATYSVSGGGVYVDGSNGVFNMNGGTICGNTGHDGGGVFVGSSGNNLGVFTMTGGTISGNTGYNGGGVNNLGIFTMTGGNISNNVITSYNGGGVYMENGSFNISGSPVISGNIKRGSSTSSPDNVCLKSGKVITVTGALTNAARIGVTTWTKPTAGTPVTFVQGSSYTPTIGDISCFSSDNSAYGVYLNGSGEAALGVAYAVNIDGGITNGTVSADQVTAAAGAIVTLTVSPAEGYSINTVSYNDGTDHEITAVNDVYSFTMPAGNVTVTATYKKASISISFIDNSGVTVEGIKAIPLDNTMTTLEAGSYYVNSDLTFTGTVTMTGNVNLILGDGCTMNIGSINGRINGKGISLPGNASLTIFYQRARTGALNIYTTGDDNNGIQAKAITIEGGNITVDTEGQDARAIYAVNGDVYIKNGNITVTAASSDAILVDNGNFKFRGGNLTTSAHNGYAIEVSASAGRYDLTRRNEKDCVIIGSTGLYYQDATTVNFDGMFTDGTNIYYRTNLTGSEIKTLAGKTLRPVLGVYLDDGGVFPNGDASNREAELTWNNNDPVIIPIDLTVEKVVLEREFTVGKPATIMLPFSKNVSDISGATFYTFGGVTYNSTTGKWEATMNEVAGSITANTPYLVMPSDTYITFNGGATLNTTGGGGQQTAQSGSNWTFKGTYEYREWYADGANADEIGKAYGFAGVERTDLNVEVGDFVKVAEGARIRPKGCYLLWSNTPNASLAPARGMNRAASVDELPGSITVRLVGANGQVTGIGELDIQTGEITFDADSWYTLDGIRLNGKPVKSGIYINNGKQVSIKYGE